jgi:hypothetical protein
MTQRAMSVDLWLDPKKNAGCDLITLLWSEVLGVAKVEDTGLGAIVTKGGGAPLFTKISYKDLEQYWATWLSRDA